MFVVVCFCSFLGVFHVGCHYILSEFLTGKRVESCKNKPFWELPCYCCLVSRVRLCNPTDRSTPGLPVPTISWSSLKLMSIESAMPSNHLILCHPLLLPPAIFPSIRVFSNGWALSIRWPKYWSFIISSPNEYSGLISFRIDWFDLLAVQGILKDLLQNHSLKQSILWCSVFFMVQLP